MTEIRDMEAAVKMLDSKNKKKRRDAVEYIGMHGDDVYHTTIKASELLENLMTDKDRDIRYDACRWLSVVQERNLRFYIAEQIHETMKNWHETVKNL